MITSPRNYIFFKVEKDIADKIVSETGFTLYRGLGYNPGQQLFHVPEYGEVVAAPLALNSKLETNVDVKVGDRVYFHFHTVDEENFISEVQELDGQLVYKVFYNECYCAVRDGKIIMLNHNVFCTPVMQEQEDGFSKSGIQLRPNVDPLPVKQRAIVAHMPDYKDGVWRRWVDDTNPLNQEGVCEVNDVVFSAGDEVHYAPESDIPIEIEGETFYRMEMHDVLAIIEGDVC